MSTYVVVQDLTLERTRSPFEGMAVGGVRPSMRAVEPPQLQVEVAHLEKTDIEDVLRDPKVLAISPSMPTKLVEPRMESDAAAAPSAWGIAAVQADASTFDGAGTVVAVLDTGIDNNHPAFQGVTIVEQDFSGSGNGDGAGHGTHCAGTIFGRDVGGTRIGIARGVDKALIGKVLDNQGSGTSEMIFRGIQWAIDQGADVISMSLGFDFPGLAKELTDGGWPTDLATSAALEAYRANLRAFDALMAQAKAMAAFGKGAVIVAAAGNESHRDVDKNYEVGASIPAAADGVVSVGALQRSTNGAYSVADFSNTFPQVSAPGVSITSAKPGGGLQTMSGTSMATPHVAGVTALWWQAVRSMPVPPLPSTVLAKVLASARSDVFAASVDVEDRGVGLVTAP
jgi:subtilisin family serine protease